MYIAGQIVGVFVTIAAIVSLQFKKMTHILAGQIVANLLLMLNYALLNAWSGATIAIIATVQTIIMFLVRLTDGKISKKTNTLITVIITLIFAGVFAYSAIKTYSKPVDIFSILASLVFCASIAQKNASLCRILSLFNSCLWIGYDIGTYAYTTIITHAFSLSSALLGIIRLDIKSRCHSEQSEESFLVSRD